MKFNTFRLIDTDILCYAIHAERTASEIDYYIIICYAHTSKLRIYPSYRAAIVYELSVANCS